MSGYRELLIGCGFARDRRIASPGVIGPDAAQLPWKDLYTLDSNEATEPDFVCDLDLPVWYVMGKTERAVNLLSQKPARALRLLPDESFDEVHAYEVLEHLGSQGKVSEFFDTFNEIYRILRPNGYLCATVPDYRSHWAWGDPGHRRIITVGSLVFLSDVHDYRAPPSSDYRRYRQCNFDLAGWNVLNGSLAFVLWKRPRAPA